MQVLHGMGPFGNEDSKKHINLYISMLRFDEDMDNHEEVWLEKGGNLIVINGVSYQGLFVHILLCVPVYLEMRMFLHPRYREDLSPMRILRPPSRENQIILPRFLLPASGEKVKGVLPTSTVFSNVSVLGNYVLNPIIKSSKNKNIFLVLIFFWISIWPSFYSVEHHLLLVMISCVI